MDIYALEAVAIAGVVASLLQERFFSRFEGNAARAVSVLAALVIGAVAVARVGVPGIGAPQTDSFGFALEVLKVAGAVLLASQAAFRVLVKPVAT